MTQRLRTINETQNEEVEFGKRQRLKNGWDFLCLCSTSTTTSKVGRISSVSRALDCISGDREFDSRGRTNTQGLKITEK